MPRRVLPYQLFDADNHLYEPRDSFTRHIPPAFADQTVRSSMGPDGGDLVFVGDRPVAFLGDNQIYDRVGRPGSLREFLARLKSGNVANLDDYWEAPRPEYRDRDVRLELMDRQGLEGCVMFGSIGAAVEHYMPNVDVLYANLHAYNQWLEEDWGFAYRNRIFTPPLISLRDRGRAVAELEWVLGRGAKVIQLRPGHAYGRSPGDPYFDPFWARVEEARCAVAYHVNESGYNAEVSTRWGHAPDVGVHRMSAWQFTHCFGDRPIMETVSALIFDNLFGRFPGLKVVSVENGADWVPYLLPRLDKMRGMGRAGPWIGGELTERPSAIFKRHLLVTPYPEEDVRRIIDAVGGGEWLVMGSDWPHPEGFAEPADFAALVDELSPDLQRRIMRDNARGLVLRD